MSANGKELYFDVDLRGVGTSEARKVRRQGRVPAVVYGSSAKSIPLYLSLKAAEKYIKKAYDNKIFTFKSKSKELNGLKVLKKAVSYHKLNRKPLHMDFFSLDMNKKVRVNVEVQFTGQAKGVKESGGVFSATRRNVEIECLPGEIPDFFSIDISPLDMNQSFHVQDLKIPSHIKLITQKQSTLCAVTELKEEESPKEAAAADKAASSGEKTSTTTPAATEGEKPTTATSSTESKAPAVKKTNTKKTK